MEAVLATIVAGRQAGIWLNIEVIKNISFYFNLQNQLNGFDGGLGTNMGKAAQPLDCVDS